MLIVADTMGEQSATPERCLEFGPIMVRFDARVLAPRPWTLLQSRWAAQIARAAAPGPILELCSGAGQIGLAAAVLSGRPLVQVDAAPVACDYAIANATSAGIRKRVDVRCCRLDVALRPNELFPVIVADPPYLPSVDIDRWPDDPPTAIDGGADGLDLIRMCLLTASQHLAPEGVLLLQVAGGHQATTVARYVDEAPHLCLQVVAVRHHDEDRAVMMLENCRSTGR